MSNVRYEFYKINRDKIKKTKNKKQLQESTKQNEKMQFSPEALDEICTRLLL